MPIRLQTPLPGPRSRELMALRERFVARGPFHATPVFAARAQGALIEDVDGNTLIDFASGIGVVNAGHAPPSVVKAASEQAGRILHAGFNVTPYEGYVRLAERLAAVVPCAGPRKTLLVNSGAEAVENAVKIARAATGRPRVVCFEHGFHGRTYMAMTLTAKEKPYKEGFGPFCAEVTRVPFPYCYRWPGTSDPERVAQECFAAMTAAIAPEKTAAVIIEPVLGEGGFVPAPAAFLKKLRAYCSEHGIVLVADEIQSGFGRTGTLFACEQLDVEPDLMTLAKGLAGGLPLAAVVGRAELMDAPVVGGIGGTYGGNPVACAAALAVLDLFQDGSLLKRARVIGEILTVALEAWKQRFPRIGDARGLGPMRALELVRDRASKEPDKEAASGLARWCWEHGLVVLTAGTFGNVIRLLVPLCITDEDLAEGLAVMAAGLAQR
ncbi:MAG: 4-aminobutyrate--2-oxoglutarate transaminase [Elusimicrobia bacterium]|nr:4-aminobutyrate--2-oxoglutarate transaminase [Elusimicrobiota bacterium]